MPHASDCITKSCLGCGPESDMGKLKEKLGLEHQRNDTLLEEITKVREELVEAKRRIEELEEQSP